MNTAVTTRRLFATSFAAALVTTLLMPVDGASAQDSPSHKSAPPITLRQVAPDQHFLFD
jgi:hypothetical protein